MLKVHSGLSFSAKERMMVTSYESRKCLYPACWYALKPPQGFQCILDAQEIKQRGSPTALSDQRTAGDAGRDSSHERSINIFSLYVISYSVSAHTYLE